MYNLRIRHRGGGINPVRDLILGVGSGLASSTSGFVQQAESPQIVQFFQLHIFEESLKLRAEARMLEALLVATLLLLSMVLTTKIEEPQMRGVAAALGLVAVGLALAIRPAWSRYGTSISAHFELLFEPSRGEPRADTDKNETI